MARFVAALALLALTACGDGILGDVSGGWVADFEESGVHVRWTMVLEEREGRVRGAFEAYFDGEHQGGWNVAGTRERHGLFLIGVFFTVEGELRGRDEMAATVTSFSPDGGGGRDVVFRRGG